MESMDMVCRGIGDLFGRLDGPLHFRLVVMPLVVSTLAIRAGLRDAREGRPSFVWSLVTHPAERPRLLRSALKDIGKIIVVALVLDTVYQLMVFRAFHVVQALTVAVACAIVPYILLRGPVTLLARRTAGKGRKQAG